MSVEIYALCDPCTGEVRYVGKANNSKKRLKTHIQESELNRPVNRWVRKLLKEGKTPVLRVLEIVGKDEWEDAEKRLIAKFRSSGRLLNIADGGAMPSATVEQRRKAALASNASQLEARKRKLPEEVEHDAACFNVSKLHGKFMQSKDYTRAYTLRLLMKCWYASKPEWHPKSWATL